MGRTAAEERANALDAERLSIQSAADRKRVVDVIEQFGGATCSCKQLGDCPVKGLPHDGQLTTALCTADELRGWLRRVISAQELMYWRERCQKAESAISFAKQAFDCFEVPEDGK